MVITIIGEEQSVGRWYEGQFEQLAQLPIRPDP
jgi:hypothetical protein